VRASTTSVTSERSARAAGPEAMRPSVVHVPDHRCELFDLRVRFGHDRIPPRVWTMRDVHQSVGAIPDGRPHPVDGAGEVHLRFRRLVPGLAYGARWESDEVGAVAAGLARPIAS